ncbi:MAG: hypothetical protein CVU46_08340 [Chloroflexi bacterium HGW-Chloroflexi-8]|jgi:hypothetical protein|nr:MAG: hypothetical protein CVU46_08340 [Chloroflexi bacterium HGW-Chloroflexi-8]
MNEYQSNLAIFLILFSVISLISLAVLDKKKWLKIRDLPSVKNFYKIIGFSIEQGKRIHISIGNSKIEHLSGAASLISLLTLKKLSELGNLSDKPPIITSGNGDLSILSQDIIKNSYKTNNSFEKFDKNRVYMTGPTRFSYISGTLSANSDDIDTQTIIGHIGPEIGILLDDANRKHIASMAATDSLSGQSVSYVMADEVVFGEDIFAIPANIQENSINNASLQTQDFLRIIAIIILIFSCVLKLVGIL